MGRAARPKAGAAASVGCAASAGRTCTGSPRANRPLTYGGEPDALVGLGFVGAFPIAPESAFGELISGGIRIYAHGRIIEKPTESIVFIRDEARSLYYPIWATPGA